MKAQISAEMIIILAVLLALVLVVATQLQKTASTGANQSEQLSAEIFRTINETAGVSKKPPGSACVLDSQCESGVCVGGVCA